jgi:integrase
LEKQRKPRKPPKPLTAITVARIKPPKTGQEDHFDQGYPGLSLRVSYGGTRTFVLFYRFNGKVRRLTLGPLRVLREGEKQPEPIRGRPITLAGARQLWREAREDVQAGRDLAAISSRKVGVSDFETVAKDWLKRDQRSKLSYKEVERIVDKHLIPAWGQRDIASIERRDVLDLIDAIADAGKETLSRRVQAYIHRLFRWYIGRVGPEKFGSNPAADLPKHGEEVRRDRVLDDNELASVWKAADQMGWPYGVAVQLLILTGQRRGKISAMCWSDIKDGIWEIPYKQREKGTGRTLELPPLALSLLENSPRIDGCDLVFTMNGIAPINGWNSAKKRIDKIVHLDEHWTWHDLRRTASTGMNTIGIDPHIVEAVLGHSLRGVAGTYNRAQYKEDKRVALEKWAKHVEKLLGTVESKA